MSISYQLALMVVATAKLHEDSFNRGEAHALREAGAKSAEDFEQCYDKTVVQAAAEVCTDPGNVKVIELILADYRGGKEWAEAVIAEAGEIV